jgi:hypothetical protein
VDEHSTDALDALHDAAATAERADTRLTDRVEFVAFTDEVVPQADLRKPLQAMGVAAYPELRAEIEAGEVEVRTSGIGRGAEAEAIALALAAISGVIYVMTQAADKVLDVAQKASELWGKLGARRGRITLSLGAVKALCVEDLRRQIGSLDDVFFFWVGDIGGGLRVDAGHTGEDIFLVHMARIQPGEGRSWVYVVDSNGRVLQQTSFLQHPATYGRIVGSFDDSPPVDLHYLLDDEGS